MLPDVDDVEFVFIAQFNQLLVERNKQNKQNKNDRAVTLISSKFRGQFF